MKLSDILLFEKPSINLVVIKSGLDYRIDPNPMNTDKEAWTTDITQAKVFKEKVARRFLQKRMEIAKERKVRHDKLNIVQVELDEHGRPIDPEKANKKPSLFDRMRRRRAA